MVREHLNSRCKTAIAVFGWLACSTEGISQAQTGGNVPPAENVTVPHDIAEDAELVSEVTKLLPPYATGAVLDDRDAVARVPENEILPDASANVRACLRQVLSIEVFSGTSPETVELYGIQKGESGIVKTYFEWNGVEVTVAGGGGGLFIRLRAPTVRLISSNPLEEPGLAQLSSLMRQLLQIPYDPATNGEIHGKATVIHGTTVYTAQLERRGVDTSALRMQGRHAEIQTFDSMYVFVSDSLPQYISFSIGPCGPPEPVENVSRNASGPPPPFRLRPLPPQPGDDDPDIANRPSFRRALGRHRIVGTGDLRSQVRYANAGSVRRRDDIPPDFIQAVWSNVERVVPRSMRPPSAQEVDWSMVDMYQQDPRQNPIRGKWSVNGRTIVVNGAGDIGTIVLTFKLSGDERIPMRPASEGGAAAVRAPRPNPIDKPKLHQFLTTTLAFPFPASDDFLFWGGGGEVVEGVLVSSCNIRSKELELRQADAAVPENDKNWFDDARVFMTDSDPQYVSITIDAARGRKP